MSKEILRVAFPQHFGVGKQPIMKPYCGAHFHFVEQVGDLGVQEGLRYLQHGAIVDLTFELDLLHLQLQLT